MSSKKELYYEMRVNHLVENAGLTQSDAQACVDANDLRLKNFALTDDPNVRCVATWQDELESKMKKDAILDADLEWEREGCYWYERQA